MGTGIVLLGHGSHISPETAGILWQQVDALRALGVADEISAAFWKEQPSFREVCYSMKADDITLIPLFTAQGYFTKTVIPAEMSLTGQITKRDDRLLRYAPPFGSHPALADLLQARLDDMLQSHQLPPQSTAVALVGHGTRRNPESRTLTEKQAQKLRESGQVAEVVAVYLDDTPSIPEVYTLTNQPNLIVIPYFLALGSHTTIDVPQELGLEQGQDMAEIESRQIYYALPLGLTDNLTDLILDLARAVDAPLSETKSGSVWSGFPQVGASDFVQFAQKGYQWGELWFSGERVCHADDREQSGLQSLKTPAELRNFIRQNPFRPLHSARNLPRGWQVIVSDPDQLPAIAETIYPAALATAPVTPFDQLISRQTGMYRQVDLQPEQVAQICGACVKYPAWFAGKNETHSIICAEACNWWLSRSQEE